MSESKPKNDMSKARAALAKKRQEERAKLFPPEVTNPNASFTQHPTETPKKRKRESSSSDEESSDSSEEDMEVEEETPSNHHPLKAKGVSLEITPIAPKSKRNVVQVKKKPRTEPSSNVSVSASDDGGQSGFGSIFKVFGEGVADAIPKLVVMAAGFVITVALQGVAARSSDSNHHLHSLPPAAGGNQVPPSGNPHDMPQPLHSPSHDYPSFISSR